jgi:hypothetical protein
MRIAAFEVIASKRWWDEFESPQVFHGLLMVKTVDSAAGTWWR